MSDSAIRRITLLSFRTFGDYVLKAPFLFELGRLYPNAEVTMITNRKGRTGISPGRLASEVGSRRSWRLKAAYPP